MGTIAKFTVGGALALGAVSANAAIATPSSGSSDAILFAEVLNGSTVVASYAGDTGISLNKLIGGTNTTHTVLSGDANLAALFAADKSGDTLYWAIEGGQYTSGGSNTTNCKTTGNCQYLTTTGNNALVQLSLRTTINLDAWGNGLQSDIPTLNGNITTNGNGISVEGGSVASAGLWDLNTGNSIANWYNNGVQTGNTNLSANLFYVTGGGSSIAKVSITNLGTATLSATGLQIPTSAGPVDSYNLATRKLTMPTLGIGAATYTNTIVTVAGIVTPPSGTSPKGSEDTYNPANSQLTVQAVMVGSSIFYNAVVSLAGLDSIGSVTGADSYSAPDLTISAVQVGSTVYTDVIITVAGIDRLTGGMPMAALDTYNFSNRELTIAAVQVGSKVYTNVTITVGSILHVGGSHPAIVTPASRGWFSEPSYFDHSADVFGLRPRL
jgi:hypothetical protein